MRAFFALPLLAMAPLALVSPLAAQTATPVAKTAEAQPAPPPSADRITAAKPVIDKLWPLGTYRKMMGGQMADMVNSMMASMFDMKSEDFLPGADIPESEKGKTLGEVAANHDPYFRERMRIMMDVMFKEMAPIMDKIEPGVRSALAKDYARTYTSAQLHDLDRFLATPTGKVYAQNWVASFYSPEMMGSMKDFVPEIMSAMPDIMKKFEEATAHLPPPPKTEAESATEAASDAAAAAAEAVQAVKDAEAAGYQMDKWSAADRQQFEQLRGERDTYYLQQEMIDARISLHALEAKERTGQKLDKYEINQRDELRDLLKDKK